MAGSTTVVIALKFNAGVLIAADSQASDNQAMVRWPVEKLEQVGGWPLVLGFSGSSGIAKQARADVGTFGWKGTTFAKPELVRRALESKVAPHHGRIRAAMTPQSLPFDQVFGQMGLWGMAAYAAGNDHHILEFEASGTTDTHDYFHTVGSGSPTAYAVWRTLGGRALLALDEGRAIHLALRILETVVNLDVGGVSAPYSMFVLSNGQCRRLSEAELNAELETVARWQQQELESLLKP